MEDPGSKARTTPAKSVTAARAHGAEHHYVFRLLALHAPSDLDAGADRATFDDAVAPLVHAEARLIATYERK